MLLSLGAYCDTGKDGPLPPYTGDPRPVIPETLWRLLLGYVCKVGCVLVWLSLLARFSFNCKFRAGSDSCAIDGGVTEPLVGVVPWLPSLDVSAERSVLKLALDLLRICLKLLKIEGDIATYSPGGGALVDSL